MTSDAAAGSSTLSRRAWADCRPSVCAQAGFLHRGQGRSQPPHDRAVRPKRSQPCPPRPSSPRRSSSSSSSSEGGPPSHADDDRRYGPTPFLSTQSLTPAHHTPHSTAHLLRAYSLSRSSHGRVVWPRSHYFKDRLLKSFDFTFPFWCVRVYGRRTHSTVPPPAPAPSCALSAAWSGPLCAPALRRLLTACALTGGHWACSIPNSTNTWEAIYEVPELTAEERAEILASPFEVHTYARCRRRCCCQPLMRQMPSPVRRRQTGLCRRGCQSVVATTDYASCPCCCAQPWQSRSDSFYFVDGQLIMHTKAVKLGTPLSSPSPSVTITVSVSLL